MKSIFPITALLLTTMAGAEPMQQTLEPSAAKFVVQHLIADLDAYIFPEKTNVSRAYLLQHMDAYEATTTRRPWLQSLPLTCAQSPAMLHKVYDRMPEF